MPTGETLRGTTIACPICGGWEHPGRACFPPQVSLCSKHQDTHLTCGKCRDELMAERDRLRTALEEIRDGLANTPNCHHDPDINIALDALCTYAESILKAK